jgi:hypothetical protein
VHLFTALGDDLVAFEGDEGQAHGDEHAAVALRQEILGEDRLPIGSLQGDPDSEADEDRQDDDLADGDDVAGPARLRRPPVIDPGKQRNDADREPLLDWHEGRVETAQSDERQHQLEIGAEA